METTDEGTIAKLDADEIAELKPDLVPLRALVGKTIVEVRDVVGYTTFGVHDPIRDGGTWPVVLVCDDGSISQIAGQLAEYTFSNGTVEGLINASLVTSEQIAMLQVAQDKAASEKAEIESLRKERLGLIGKLAERNGFRSYRGLARQIKGVEDRLMALGALK